MSASPAKLPATPAAAMYFATRFCALRPTKPRPDTDQPAYRAHEEDREHGPRLAP